MFDWLNDLTPAGAEPLDVLARRLGMAFLLGVCVAGIYAFTHSRPRHEARGLVPTLVLLSVLIAMVTLVIGNSIARAFSLVGALSIVRFRTVVEDTRDTAFVIFAVVVGMAAGAGPLNFFIPLVGIPVVAVAALLFRARPVASAPEATLLVRLGSGYVPHPALDEVFAKHVTSHRVQASATARQGAALDVTYRVCLRTPAAALPLVSELNQLEGVQSAELRLEE